MNTCVETRETVLGDGSSSFRCRYRRAGQPSGSTLVVVQSGHSGPCDERSEESALYERVADRVGRLGIGTLRFDAPLREHLDRPASDTHVEERVRRLRAVLELSRLRGPSGTLVVLASSLGGLVTLRAFTEGVTTSAPAALVLVGTVVEAPVQLPPDVRSVDLVYGSRDLLLYVDEAGTATGPLSPSAYGPGTAAMLRSAAGARVTPHVLDGFDHGLTEHALGDGGADAADSLAELVVAATEDQACP